MPQEMPQVPPNAAQAKIVILTTALQLQMKFLERIESAETGWWDRDEMADQKAAIWNALEEVR
jgi:hypothetical protein